MKNLVHSIQDRLLQIARETTTEHQLILTRYFQERLLFRLASSPFVLHFCLKGGVLLYALEKEKSRPTLDLDLSARRLKRDAEKVLGMFREICAAPCEADGMYFNPATAEIQQIMEQNKYAGFRIKVLACLGKIQQRLQIDIGFGDVITPAPVEMEYPTLLQMPAPQLLAYSVETVLAEKFEAMIALAESNSRMKDFYDVFHLLQANRYHKVILGEAVTNTFRHRGTDFQQKHPLFSPEFATNPQRLTQWQSFLKRSKLRQDLAFGLVHQTIVHEMEPIYTSLKQTVEQDEK